MADIRTTALIVAAGRGTRVGPGGPKQYRRLGGRTLLAHTLAVFESHPAIDGILVVIHADDREAFAEASAGFKKLLPPTNGGATRQASVRAGLEALKTHHPERVLIHDAARPFVSPALIDGVLAGLDTHAGALPALAVADTLRHGQVADGSVMAGETVPRDGLWRAQTPQGFRFADILAAHRAAEGQDLTDDVAVATAGGIGVVLTPGAEENFKVTTADDLARAERALGKVPDIRTGMGFDVHAFGPGDHVWLCGVQIPHDGGLVGHSDADAGLHALTDAVLGALAEGDIGAHFPPSDPQWKGAPSDLFLAHAGKLAHEKGARILHLDLTLICERPKIRPHVDTMRARVAEILGIAIERVSIKATTTEKLGFTGRREGLAAQAIATLAFV